MASGPSPYDFEPTFTQEELQNRNTGSNEMEVDVDNVQLPGSSGPTNRREHTNWCSCGNCQIMPLEKECLCCHEIEKLKWLMEDTICITSHADFLDVCTNRAVLRAAHIMRRDVRGHDRQGLRDLSNRSLRYSAYRMFVSWSHGHLGKGIRRVIPACAVTAIRRAYPEVDGIYIGFRAGDDDELLEDSEVYASA